MKPNHINRDNPKQVKKLEDIMKSDKYVAEEKIDGCHYLSIGGRFFSTRISDITGLPVEKTENLPHLVQILHDLNLGKVILDGEINYPGMKSQDVITVTGSLPNEAIRKQEHQGWLHYTMFDILRSPNGEWLINKPWIERRKILEAVGEYIKELYPKASKFIHVNPVTTEDKQAFLENVLDKGGEGIVLKNIYSPYYPGKKPMWVWMKIKAETEDDVVIMGFEPPEKEYTGKNLETWPYWEDNIPVTKYYYHGWIGAIIMGKYNKEGQLVKIGTCSGMDEQQRQEFSLHPEKYIGKVAKIKAMEITRDGAYRHPTFVGIHSDKNPYECKL